MRAGRLRHRVRVERDTSAQDGFGAPSVSWSSLGTRWASVEDLAGRELIEARQVESRATVRVTMRYFDRMTASDRLIKIGPSNTDARTLNITHVGDPVGRARMTQILCIEAE